MSRGVAGDGADRVAGDGADRVAVVGADRVAVVGAGSAGVTAAKNLREHGFDVDVFERNDGLGGNWDFGAPTSRVYASTRMISSKPFTQIPDFPMPDAAPDYLDHREVLAYLRGYARHFGVERAIQYASTVTRVGPAAASSVGTLPDAPWWDVEVERDGFVQTHRYAAVVVANGHNWHPKRPSIPGQASFAGTVLHAADYREPSVFTGRRVLVVGAGNTGCDLAVEAAHHAAATFHSTRRGYWYAKKYTFGRPSDQVMDVFFSLGLPTRVVQRLMETTLRATVGDLTRYGLRAPDHRPLETHPIVNSTLIDHLARGAVTPRGDVARFDRSGVVYADGTRDDVDLVLFATGYLLHFPFLSDELLTWKRGRPVLHRNVWPPKPANLAFVGLIQPNSGQFLLQHWQAVAIARYWRAQRESPAIAERFAAHVAGHAAERDTAGIELIGSTRHLLEVEHRSYLRQLDLDINERLRTERGAVGDRGGGPSRAADAPLELREPVMQRLDWSFPAPPVRLRVTEATPAEPAAVRPPLLFVHGASHAAWAWEEHWMPAAAASGWRSYAVELRGHGASGGRERLRWTPLRHYVHDVLQVITELPEPPVLVGHSMGGLVVQHVLARYPAAAGVLIAPMPATAAPRVLGALLRHRPLDALGTLVGRPARFGAELLFGPRVDPADAAAHEARLGDESLLAELQVVGPGRRRMSRAPVLVLGGGADRLLAPVDAVRIARHYGTRARLFPAMGHDLMLDAGWEAPLGVMLDWLERAVPAGRGARQPSGATAGPGV